MGTLGSELLTKSAQKLKQHEYRMDLERQILESKMRKEEERKERDANDHPLGPDYAYPVPTYKSSPYKITGIGNPQETDGSTTVLRGVASVQKAKVGKSSMNLMKSRMQPGDPNQDNSSGRIATNQSHTKEKTMLQNGMLMHPENRSRFFHQHKTRATQPLLATHPPSPQNMGVVSPNGHLPAGASSSSSYQIPLMPVVYVPMHPVYNVYPGMHNRPAYSSVNHDPVHSHHHTFQHHYNPGTNHNHHQQQFQGMNLPPLLPPKPQRTLQQFEEIPHDQHFDDDRGVDSTADTGLGENDTEIEFDALRKARKTRKIWQTSDEVPDPELSTEEYKAELRKQIDDDRKRKAEREAQEKEEDERIERKIKEAEEEGRKRIVMEQQRRTELERTRRRNKIEARKNEAFVISQPQHNPDPNSQKVIRSRSRSSLLAEKLARYGPEANHFGHTSLQLQEHEQPSVFYGDIDDYIGTNTTISPIATLIADSVQQLRRGSPPVPVVRRKLVEDYIREDNTNVHAVGQINLGGGDLLFEMETHPSSARDIVERGLQEKVESMNKSAFVLKNQWII